MIMHSAKSSTEYTTKNIPIIIVRVTAPPKGLSTNNNPHTNINNEIIIDDRVHHRSPSLPLLLPWHGLCRLLFDVHLWGYYAHHKTLIPEARKQVTNHNVL